MAGLHVEHVFHCNQDTFWQKVFLDDEYNRRMFLDHLHFSVWKVLSQNEQGGQVRRVIQAAPPLGDVPDLLRPVIGSSAEYEEHGTLDRDARHYQVKVVPGRLADRIRIELEMTTRPEGPDRCRRIVQGEVRAKIFGVGGLLEKKLVSDLTKSYENSAAFTNQFLAEKGWT
jgi:Protein of unknown function (DUF2505)